MNLDLDLEESKSSRSRSTYPEIKAMSLKYFYTDHALRIKNEHFFSS